MRFEAGILPDGKSSDNPTERVWSWVAMAHGDGVNDALALAAAVGI